MPEPDLSYHTKDVFPAIERIIEACASASGWRDIKPSWKRCLRQPRAVLKELRKSTVFRSSAQARASSWAAAFYCRTTPQARRVPALPVGSVL